MFGILQAVTPKQYRDMFINKLLNNQGLYITCSDTSIITKYASIGEYIDKNA